MLRRFLHLNAVDLGTYVTALEGGLTTESTKRSKRSSTGEGGVDIKVAHASGDRSHEDEESRTLADTDEARFDRLLRGADATPDILGWVEVLQPDTDFDGIGIGAMVSWECNLYIPDIIQAMARQGEALGAINLMQNSCRQRRAWDLTPPGYLVEKKSTLRAHSLEVWTPVSLSWAKTRVSATVESGAITTVENEATLHRLDG